jgi:hypothetical protein
MPARAILPAVRGGEIGETGAPNRRRGTLGQVLAELDAELFVGRDAEQSVFREWLAESGSPPRLLYVWGPGGVGKSALLRAFERSAAELDRPAFLVDGREVAPTPDGLLGALGGGPLQRAVDELNDRGSLLLVDTFEALADLTHFFQHELLPRLGTQVKVVLAGRDVLGLAWGGWRQLIQPLELGAVTPADSQAYLASRGVRDRNLVDQIQHATRGHPLALCLAADLVQQVGVRDLAHAPEWRLLVRWLIEQLLGDVHDVALRELLEAGAVVRQFDEATLAAVAGRDDIDDAFARLCGLSIVRAGQRGLRLHDDVRHILLEDLRWRHAERFRDLRMRALAYYRERVRSAFPPEREWLLAERLGLWENTFVQALLFTEEEEGRVFLDWGRPEDHDEVAGVWTHWLENWLTARMRLDFDTAMDRMMLDAVLSYPATWVRVARDRDGRAAGFGTAVPICSGSLPILERHPGLAPLASAYRARFPVAAGPEQSNSYFFFHLAHNDLEPTATQQALIRNIFGLFARGGIYMVCTPIPEYKTLFESLGFQLMPEARNWFWGGDFPVDGYLLDLTGVGVEPWLEAIVAGRQPPRTLAPSEIARALQEALMHWHNNTRLLGSPLAATLGASTADGLRAVVRETLEARRPQLTRQVALAYRALELAYFTRASSLERAAEELAVSRSTFYRLLRRGVNDLAAAIAYRQDSPTRD